ncbi:MAG: hypothetical protein RLO12_03605 [Fulvivirga sp.]
MNRLNLELLHFKTNKLSYSRESTEELEINIKDIIQVFRDINEQDYTEEIDDLEYAIEKYIGDCKMNSGRTANAEFARAQNTLLRCLNTLLNHPRHISDSDNSKNKKH